MENNAGLTNEKKAWEIFKWSLRKKLPFSIAYWILLFLTFPMAEIFMIIVTSGQEGGLKEYASMMKEEVYYIPSTFFAVVAILFSIIMAIMSFSYMHNKRSVDLFGSYPVSRRTLFFVRYLSTLTVCIVPVAVIGLTGGILGFSDTAIVQTMKTVMELIVAIIGNISFIAFISLCCGTVADLLITYIVISIIYPICVLIGNLFPASVIPGMTASVLPSTVFTFLAPEAAFFTGHFGTGKVIGIVWTIALSAVLMISCYILCKRRKAESAQNAFAFNIVEIVIKFFTCFATGFGIGFMCSFLGEWSMKGQYIWFAVGAFMAIMTANILLHLVFHRGLSGYMSSLLECGVVYVCLIVFLLFVTSGGLGYAERIPDKNDIKEVSIQTGDYQSFSVGGKDLLQTFTDDEKIIDETINIHKLLVDGLDKHGGFFPIVNRSYSDRINHIKVTYRLRNGKVLIREYNSDDINSKEKEIQSALKTIKQTDYYLLANHPFNSIPDKYIESLNVSKYVINTSDSDVKSEDYNSSVPGYIEFDIEYIDRYENRDKLKKIIKVLKEDYKINGMYIPKDKERIYAVDISYAQFSNNRYDESEWANSIIYIPKTYTNTIKLFKEYGFYNEEYYNLINDEGVYVYSEHTKNVLSTNDKIYFECPSNWDQSGDIHCAVFDEEKQSFCELKNNITECTRISGNIWSYTMPDTVKYDVEYNGTEAKYAYRPKYVMFYQIGNEDMNLSGVIALPDKYNGSILCLKKQLTEDSARYLEPMYKYDWTKFKL